MSVTTRSWMVGIITNLVVVAAAGHAQAPEGSASLSPAAVAESLVVLRQLDSAVRAEPQNAALWYRRGRVAWALYERDRNKPPVSGLDWTMLGRLADTSMRIAALLDPANGLYRMMAGRFLLMSGVSITRVASYGFFDAALEAARATREPRVLAEAAVEAGRVHWRRYDALANRYMDIGVGDCGAIRRAAVVGAMARDSAGVRKITDVEADMRTCSIDLGSAKGFSGEGDYIQTEALFKEAFDADPTFERAYRQYAMLLVERNRWSEVHTIAQARVKAAPDDAWAWLTIGLARHRMKLPAKTTDEALERGLSLLTPRDRARLDRLERVVRPDDSTRFRRMDPTTRAAVEKLYWKAADPLWARDGNEGRSEFLARVTYSELRWTAEEMKIEGADTDRGDIHIRYGPPDFIRAVRPVNEKGVVDKIFTMWSYNAGFTFYFVGQPTFATAFFNPDRMLEMMEVIRERPMTIDNVRNVGIDTIPVQAARFRAATDSVDFVLATAPPIAGIKRVAEVAGKVRTDFWLLRGGIQEVAHDSSASDSAGIRTYTSRIASGTYLYRTEATADGSLYAARATAAFTVDSASFPTRGFGISDLLVATRAASRGTPSRWSDLELQPLVGTIARQGTLALVWENYELGAENGAARYLLAVSIERQRSLAGRIAATIVRGVGSAVGVDRAEDRVTIRYERNLRHSNVIVDNVELALGTTPPGNYLIQVQITDRVSGRVASRTIPITIAEK